VRQLGARPAIAKRLFFKSLGRVRVFLTSMGSASITPERVQPRFRASVISAGNDRRLPKSAFHAWGPPRGPPAAGGMAEQSHEFADVPLFRAKGRALVSLSTEVFSCGIATEQEVPLNLQILQAPDGQLCPNIESSPTPGKIAPRLPLPMRTSGFLETRRRHSTPEGQFAFFVMPHLRTERYLENSKPAK
jgi:hypothetical protein